MRKSRTIIPASAWPFVAALCLLAAFAFWWRGMSDAAFVASVLGIVAWFWRLRNRYRAIRIETEAEDNEDEETQEGFKVDRE